MKHYSVMLDRALRFSLTKREQEVLYRLAEGLSTSQIAKDLEVTESMIRNHLASAGEKLAATSRAHLIARAVDEGVIVAQS
jgi:DNA-binding CsgD family transcriptional regulator